MSLTELLARAKAAMRRVINRPCDCDACTGRERYPSRNPRVSHGLHMWVDKDGCLHFRAKSRIVDL